MLLASLALCFTATACKSPERTELGLARSGARRSNILLIIADDLGNDEVGIYNEGDDATRPPTPNIDRLAAKGVRFTNAYSNPVCSPTRAGILTGRYSLRHGVGDIVRFKTQSYTLPSEEVSIPELLDAAESGYDHSLCGKWHLDTDASGGLQHPLLEGFNWAAGSRSNFNDYYKWLKNTNGAPRMVGTYATMDTTNDAIARSNTMTEPWFLWVAYNAPHLPFHFPPRDLHTRPGDDHSKANRYAATVEALDTEIGRLLASMHPTVRKNTIVIFLGDNGSPTKALGGDVGKGGVTEAGVNVPFIVAGAAVPAHSRGKVSKALVHTTDVYATVADIADVNVGAVLPPGRVIDSVSLLPVLADPKHASIRRYAYSERFQPNGPPPYDTKQQMIRDQRWKLVRLGVEEVFEGFYDFDAAPPNEDGENLCPCPRKLSGEALKAYNRLGAELDRLERQRLGRTDPG